MRKLTFSLIALLVLAASLSACAAKTANTTPRTISVNGSAEIRIQPDVAYISVGVQTQNANANEAVSANNAKAQAVIDALKAAGIDPKDLQTSNFSIMPNQQYDQNGQLTGVLFTVDNSVAVTLHDVTKIGDVLSAAIGAGANTVNGIQYDLLDKASIVNQARETAMQDARSQAEALAAATSVKVGPVQSISYYNNYPVPMGIGGGASLAAADYKTPVMAGQIVIRVDVSVAYEIR